MPGSSQIADSITEGLVQELTTPAVFPALERAVTNDVMATKVVLARMSCLRTRCQVATVAER
jgi:hypothetical protein